MFERRRMKLGARTWAPRRVRTDSGPVSLGPVQHTTRRCHPIDPETQWRPNCGTRAKAFPTLVNLSLNRYGNTA